MYCPFTSQKSYKPNLKSLGLVFGVFPDIRFRFDDTGVSVFCHVNSPAGIYSVHLAYDGRGLLTTTLDE